MHWRVGVLRLRKTIMQTDSSHVDMLLIIGSKTNSILVGLIGLGM